MNDTIFEKIELLEQRTNFLETITEKHISNPLKSKIEKIQLAVVGILILFSILILLNIWLAIKQLNTAVVEITTTMNNIILYAENQE